jgi:hypothetical protein
MAIIIPIEQKIDKYVGVYIYILQGNNKRILLLKGFAPCTLSHFYHAVVDTFHLLDYGHVLFIPSPGIPYDPNNLCIIMYICRLLMVVIVITVIIPLMIIYKYIVK